MLLKWTRGLPVVKDKVKVRSSKSRPASHTSHLMFVFEDAISLPLLQLPVVTSSPPLQTLPLKPPRKINPFFHKLFWPWCFITATRKVTDAPRGQIQEATVIQQLLLSGGRLHSCPPPSCGRPVEVCSSPLASPHPPCWFLNSLMQEKKRELEICPHTFQLK